MSWVSTSVAGFDKSVTVGGMIDVLGATRRAIPALSSASVAETWAGLRPYTKDQLPVLGAARTAGLFLNTGHFRGGILLAPASATALRELITTGESSYDLGPFNPSRPLGR